MVPLSLDREAPESRRPGPVEIVSPATLNALELPSLRAMLASLATTDVGAERAGEVAPRADLEELDERRGAFEEARRLLEDGALAPAFEAPLAPVLGALEEGGAQLDGEGLLQLAAMLRATGEAAARIAAADPPCERLAVAAETLEDLEPLRRRIVATLDRRGRVRDDASPRLGRLAAAARKEREGLYRQLEEYAGQRRGDLSEDTVPLYAGRLVVKLRAGAARQGGLVHGRSGTGKSFYFEPLAAVEGNNRLQEALEQVEQEKRRLLRELVELAVESRAALAAHLGLLGRLDLLQAVARFAAAADARLAEIAPPGELTLREARHPLLDPRLAPLRAAALGHEGHTASIVPLSLELGGDRRVLVVTGPNAGGKTVALKTLGLLTLLHQCGLPVPAGRGTALPLVEALVATIGDEQSLLEDRSTFSGRLQRLAEAWEAARPGGLVLLDELGSGTDPEEGAALAVALVEALVERGCLGVVTTHLGRLAAAALESDGAFCAAMEFDPESGSPTFRLTPGAPGGSEALSLARRLGLPGEWLARAEELLGSEHRDLRRLLAEVERARDELAAATREVERERAALESRRRELEERVEELAEERRRLAGRLKRELEELRRKVVERQREEVERLREELAAGRRRGVAERSAERLLADAPEIEVEEERPEAPVVAGGRVVHRTLGWEGVVERLEGSRAHVKIGGKRLRCPVSELAGVAAVEEAKGPPAPRVAVSPAGDAVPGELQLIGKRVEPALAELDAYLDAALRAAHATVRVVHGHGTGRLRSAVREFLRRHPAVASVRPGRGDEGGDGATVVEMRG